MAATFTPSRWKREAKTASAEVFQADAKYRRGLRNC